MNDQLTKVHVDLPNHWAVGGESMWAVDLGGERYRIENVPFYAYNLNFHDIVEARAQRPDLKPSVLQVVERSGHQTIRVVFLGSTSQEECIVRLKSLTALHVTFEHCSQRYFALDLEPAASIDSVRATLDQWEAEGLVEYETGEARMPGSFDAELPDDDLAP